MKTILLSALLIASSLLISGCVTNSERSDPNQLARKLFFQVLADCKKANASAVPAISLFTSHYWLPASTDALVRMGDEAVPALKELSVSSDFSQRDLALACLDIIGAKSLEKGQPREDAGSGVSIVSYSVRPQR